MTPLSINASTFTDAIKSMLSFGSHKQPIVSNQGVGYTGRLENVVGKVQDTLTIAFTSASAYSVVGLGATFAAGTVGVPYSCISADFTVSGTCTTGTSITLQVAGAPPLLKDDGTELVFAISWGTSSAFIGVTASTLQGAPALYVCTSPTYNPNLSVLAQTDVQAAYLPHSASESLLAYYRFCGSTFSLRVSNGASVKTISAGFLSSMLSPSDFSHPLFAGGPVNLSSQYAAHTFNGRSTFRTPSGQPATLSTTQVSTMSAMDYFTPDASPILIAPIHCHATYLNTFATFPHVAYIWRNTSLSTIIYTDTEMLIPTWTNTDTSFPNSFLFSCQL